MASGVGTAEEVVAGGPSQWSQEGRRRASTRASASNDEESVEEEELLEDQSQSQDGPPTLRTAPALQLIDLAPAELAAEFEERLAEMELELEEEKEKSQALSREWSQRCTELEIKLEVQETVMASVRSELQQERQRFQEEKRKLKQLYLENSTIKIVDDEVTQVMEMRDREMTNFRAVKEEEIRQIRSRHIEELTELGERFARLLSDAQKSHEVKAEMIDAVGTSKGVLVQDPLKLLEFITSMHVRLVDHAAGRHQFLGVVGSPGLATPGLHKSHATSPFLQHVQHRSADGSVHTSAAGMRHSILGPSRAVRRDYEGTLALMQDVLSLEKEQRPSREGTAEDGRMPSSPSGPAAPDLDALDEAVVLAQLEKEDASEKLQELEVYLQALAVEAREKPTSLQAMEEAHQMATEAVARFQQAAANEREAVEKKHAAEKGLKEVRLQRLLRDPLLSKVTADSDFADTLEAVMRENERLQARLQALADTPSAKLSDEDLAAKRHTLRDNVDELSRRAENLNLACERLDAQRRAFKLAAQEAAQEAGHARMPRAPPAAGAELDRIWGLDTDSEDVASVEEESESDEDEYDPAEEIARDQVAGVESLIEEPEEFEPEQYELEKKQFQATMRKEAHVASLIEQILQYLESGTVIYRLDKGQIHKDFAFLAHNRSMIQVCHFHEGKPERKRGKRMISLRDVREIILGQGSERFKTMLKRTEGNRPVDPSDIAAKVPKDSERLEEYNSGLYFYRSLSLRLKRETFDFVCNNDSDFETWVVALHRITTLDPHYGKPLDLVAGAYRGYDELEEDERVFCSHNHITPLLYLNAKMQCLKQQNKVYLTLYDVRTLSGFDLIHSQKVFELWMVSGWIEKQFVYQIRYLEWFPDEASTLMQVVDAERQKERRAEQQRLLYGDQS
eukprot:TRINITY_DN12588_c0_g1_i1.p1 TRINITY_DN12588_c0_g1~~TRINITY_DN12588_c0_g1_i1.p1  ORF type:complete len:908 (+),score=347.03 TRINITY_DN12588_c0_g1_i1:63-2786(+)